MSLSSNLTYLRCAGADTTGGVLSVARRSSFLSVAYANVR
jgi:hypothetical protein